MCRLLNGDDCRFWMTKFQICEIFWPYFKQFTTLVAGTPLALTFLRSPLNLPHFRCKPERFIHSIGPFPKTQNPFSGFASYERRRWSATCRNHGCGVSDKYIVNIPLQLHLPNMCLFVQIPAFSVSGYSDGISNLEPVLGASSIEPIEKMKFSAVCRVGWKWMKTRWSTELWW
jgi:hypothetical protein